MSLKSILKKSELKDLVMKYVGKHNSVPDEEFDPEELKMGIEVEMEHTNDRQLSKAIAKDHLAEDPKYYTKLKTIDPHHE